MHSSVTTIRRFSGDYKGIFQDRLCFFSESILFDFSFGHIFGSTGPTEKYNHSI